MLTDFQQARCRYDAKFDKMTLSVEFYVDSFGDWRVDEFSSNYSDSRYDATQWFRRTTHTAAVFDVTIENYSQHHGRVAVPTNPLHLQHVNNIDSTTLDPGAEPLRADWCSGWR